MPGRIEAHIRARVARVRRAPAAIPLIEQDDPVAARVKRPAPARRAPGARATVDHQRGHALWVAAGLPVDEVAVTGIEHAGLIRLDRGIRHATSRAHSDRRLAALLVRPSPWSLGRGPDLRRLGDLNPGRARTLTALAVRRHRPD